MEAPALPDSLWALEPRALERLRLAVSQPVAATMSGRSSLVPDAPLYTAEDGVAVIRFEGLVQKRPSFWGWLFGGSAVTETAQAALAAALADPAVRSVLLVVDSPGGTVAGTEELAEAVFRARKVKPVSAFASDMCASAAYWVASQASKLYANATATVGSIGVYAVNVDLSRMYRNEGVDVDVIKSAPGKGAGIRGTQWTPEQRSDLQREIDALGTEFVEAVRRARPAAIAAADGRCFTAREGLSLGLVDGITTLADLLGQMKADAARWPEVALNVDLEAPEPECEPEQPEAAATTSADERVAHDGSAPKEEPSMSDTNMAEVLTHLNQKLDSLAASVSEMKAERELDALIAQAKVDRKIQNPETEASVRTVGAKSLDAAKALVSNLKASGPEGGSVVDAAGSPAAENGRVVAFRKYDESPEGRKRLHADAKALVADGKAEDFTAAVAALTGKAVA